MGVECANVVDAEGGRVMRLRKPEPADNPIDVRLLSGPGIVLDAEYFDFDEAGVEGGYVGTIRTKVKWDRDSV